MRRIPWLLDSCLRRNDRVVTIGFCIALGSRPSRLSFPRKRESIFSGCAASHGSWIPACAGMTRSCAIAECAHPCEIALLRFPSRIRSAHDIGLGLDLMIAATGAFQHNDSLQVWFMTARADHLGAGPARRRLLNRSRSLVLRNRRIHDCHLLNLRNRNSIHISFSDDFRFKPASATAVSIPQRRGIVNARTREFSMRHDDLLHRTPAHPFVFPNVRCD